MSKVLLLSRWKKHPQPEREEYSDDEDSTDPFEEPGVEEVKKTASKRKRKPEIKSSKETKAASENTEEKKTSETAPSFTASSNNAKWSCPNAKKSILPPPPPVSHRFDFQDKFELQ